MISIYSVNTCQTLLCARDGSGHRGRGEALPLHRASSADRPFFQSREMKLK